MCYIRHVLTLTEILLLVGIMSGILGSMLPGPGSVYLSQDIQFLNPVFVGDALTATVSILTCEVKEKQTEKEGTVQKTASSWARIAAATTVTKMVDNTKVAVIKGTAKILVPRDSVDCEVKSKM